MANDIGPPPTGIAWDESAPDPSDAHGLGVYEIRDVRKGVRIRMSKEHVTLAGSSAGGEHKQGSAVAWIQEDEPTTRPDGTTALTSADIGRMWLDLTNGVLKILTAIGSPNTWTPYGEICLALYEVGSEPSVGLYMKGNELYFKGADGTEKFIGGLVDEDDMSSDSATLAPSQQSVKAYVDSGIVTMTNKTLTSPTLTSPVLDTAVSGTAVLDEDNMASDSATKLATQQSIKAYIDAAIAGIAFGAWTDKDTNANTLVKNERYLAQCDGFVTASLYSNNAIAFFSDASATPTTKRAQDCGYSDAGLGDNGKAASITVPVKAGHYWKITSGGTPTIYWMPMGSGGCVKQ